MGAVRRAVVAIRGLRVDRAVREFWGGGRARGLRLGSGGAAVLAFAVRAAGVSALHNHAAAVPQQAR